MLALEKPTQTKSQPSRTHSITRKARFLVRILIYHLSTFFNNCRHRFGNKKGNAGKYSRHKGKGQRGLVKGLLSCFISQRLVVCTVVWWYKHKLSCKARCWIFLCYHLIFLIWALLLLALKIYSGPKEDIFNKANRTYPSGNAFLLSIVLGYLLALKTVSSEYSHKAFLDSVNKEE